MKVVKKIAPPPSIEDCLFHRCMDHKAVPQFNQNEASGAECGACIAEKKPYVIVRTHSAGAFAGELVKRTGKEVEMRNARRLWYWAGAASLSELAQRGTSQPSKCKFPCTVDSLILTEAIEILRVSAAGRASIEAVPIWTA